MRAPFPEISDVNAYDLREEHRRLSTARYAILLLPYERTTTYVGGTAGGPQAFVAASQQVELYDAELDREPYRAGIYAAPALRFAQEWDESECLARIRAAASNLLEQNKILIGIGGEHTVTLPLVQAHQARFPDLQVLQLDAHADLRDEFEGTPLNHACVMRRVRELVSHVAVGVRSMSREETDFVEENEIPIFAARDFVLGRTGPEEVVAALDPGRPVYVTIDLDCFDPSEAPGVGTPEPGGLSWYGVTSILERVAAERRVVGFDVVELRPLQDSVVTEYLAAKLVYRMIGYLER